MLYATLNKCAKDWWYHRQLREQGQLDEARKRERASIRSNVEALRTCKLVSIGRGGWTAYLGEGHTLSGYYPEHNAVPLVAASLGIPVVDTRTVPDNNLGKLIALPMFDYGKTTGVGSFDYAPLEYLMPRWAIPTSPYDVNNVKRTTNKLFKIGMNRETEYDRETMPQLHGKPNNRRFDLL